MSNSEAVVLTLVLFACISLCYFALPGWRTTGYACHWSGEPILYKLNGPLVLLATVGAWVHLARSGSELSWRSAEFFGASFAVANALGLAATVALLTRTSREPAHRCLTVDQTELRQRAADGVDVMTHELPASPDRSAAADFFYGVAFNPQLLGCDVKMGLYALGACVLEWNLLSAAMLHVRREGSLSLALITYVALFSWFICE